MTVTIDTAVIRDWGTFHDCFLKSFGFPEFYGRNMDAWIDCMSSLDDPESGMTTVHVPNGGIVVLRLEGAADFKRRCPEQYAAMVECSAFVNWRRMEQDEPPVMALSFRIERQ